VPILRGRIVAARGVKAEDLEASTDTEWVLQSDRGLTYTGDIRGGLQDVEGEWWEPTMTGLHGSRWRKDRRRAQLKIGDEISSTCYCRVYPAPYRHCVTWTGKASHHFVLVFSPNAFRQRRIPYCDADREPPGPRRRRPHHQIGS